ncbi:MAG TPA: hypothetical protein DD727_00295, partial [Clostridiales bacterium]|nr:hypothetical protein [Clostridiales bacterium]
VPGVEIYIPLEEMIDLAKERERLTRERDQLENEIRRAEARLANAGFVSKAPPAVVEEEKAKKARYEDMYQKVTQRLDALPQ